MKKMLAFTLVAVLMLSLTACGSTDGGENSGSPVVESGEITETPSVDDNAVGMGGTISGECFDVSLVDAQWTNALKTAVLDYTPTKDGTKLLCLIFSSENTSDETQNMGVFNAYVDKQAVLPTSVVGEMDGAMPYVGAVASGMSMKAYQVWELPEDWEEFQVNYFESLGPECSQFFVIHRSDISS